jgi:5'-phosphate synthase pdxT subunit
VRIGVLALQGDFREHMHMLCRLGAQAVEVRRASDLDGIDGVVIPGGESTTIRMLLNESELSAALRSRIASGLPTLGTCAGMIVLARRVDGEPGDGLDALDINVRRNAFGRQVDSFETDLDVPEFGGPPVHAVFIRAPIVESTEPGVDVLARLDDGRVVAVRQNSVVGLSFHPEMTDDPRFHEYFMNIVEPREAAAGSST